jgi:hypothetical protein
MTTFYCLRFETLPTWWASVVLLITPLHGPSRQHRFQQCLYCCLGIRYGGNILPSRCLGTALHATIWRCCHCGDYEEYSLLRYNTMCFCRTLPVIRRNVLPHSSGSKNKPSKRVARNVIPAHCLLVCSFPYLGNCWYDYDGMALPGRTLFTSFGVHAQEWWLNVLLTDGYDVR